MLAYVAACGAETEGWPERWRQVAAAVHAHREGTQAETSPAADRSESTPLVDVPATLAVPAAPQGHGKRGATQLIMVGGALLSAVSIITAWRLLFPGSADHTSAASPRSTRTIAEGSDPQDTGCDKGEVMTVASANLYAPDRFFVGYILLRYAPACGAMWPRFQPATGMAQLDGAQVTVWITRPADGRASRYDTPYLGDLVYGNMLRTSYGCLEGATTVTAPHPTAGPTAALPGKGRIFAHAETQCVHRP
nr:hypothetical protein [Actinoallomurus iriomotensis]